MKLSIITINLNNATGLQKTMKSVFAQTFTDFEYIIIDGGSTDGSKELIENNANRFVYWISEKDKGIYNAMNKGIVNAKGDYILFLNSGDYLIDSTILGFYISYLHSFDIIYGNLLIQDKHTTWEKKYPDKITYSYFLEESLPHSGAAFIKKELFNKIGLYDESFEISADVKFYAEAIFNYNATTKHIDKTVAVFSLNGVSSLHQSRQRLFEERKRILKNVFPEYEQFKKIKCDSDSLTSFDKIKIGFQDSVVSAIITCYNSGEFLYETLDSVMNSVTSHKIEIIVIDDGSKDDDTLFILNTLQNKSYKILRQENKGPAAARNSGIKISSGEYLLFLDSDKKLRANFINKGVAILEKKKDVGVVYGKPQFFGDESTPPFNPEPFDKVKILTKNYIDMCILMRKSVWLEAGEFDESKSIFGHEDWEYWIRLINTQWKFYFLEEVCFDCRLKNNMLVTANFNEQRNREMLDYIFLKHYKMIIKNYTMLDSLHKYETKRPFRTFVKNILYLSGLKKQN